MVHADFVDLPPAPDRDEIDKTLKTLFAPEDVIELRVLHKKGKGINAGYFDGEHRDELIRAAIKANKAGNNVYVVMNPIDAQLLGRYANRMEEWANDTTGDNNITWRVRLLIDLDPVRPRGTAATDEQFKLAKKKAIEVIKFLHGEGWPSPITAGSGNGVHLLYAIDLPNDSDSRELIKGVLAALGDCFDTDAVKIDRSVFNASRITRLYGTVNTKGDHTPLAPWRLSKIGKTPETITTVTFEQLKALVEGNGQPAISVNAEAITSVGFDLTSFLTRLNIPYQQDRHDGRDRFVLAHCPFNAEHNNGEVAIFRSDSGKLGFNCFHNSCADKHWRDVRTLVDGPAHTRGKQAQDAATAPPTETPLLFDEIDTPEINSTLLPGWLGEYADAVSRSTQTPSAMAVMLALSTVATCTAKRFEVSPHGNGYSEPLNLWTATVMPPASRKTSVVEAITVPLSEYEKSEADRLSEKIQKAAVARRLIEKRIDRLERDAGNTKKETDRNALLMEIFKLRNEMPPELLPPRLWTGDTTAERLQSLLVDHGERMAVITDEGGIFEVMAGLYNDGRANLDIFLQGHAGRAVRVDRQGRTAHLDSPALSFGLAIQPAIMADMITGGKRRFRGNGTLARFLYAVPRSNVGSRDVRAVNQIPASVATNYRVGLFGLLAIAPQLINGREVPRRLTLTATALDCWHTFAEMIEQRQGGNGDLEAISDWSGKLPGAALRIAGNLHLVKHGEPPPAQIEAATIENAVMLCTLLIDHAKAAFHLMDADPVAADAKAVLKWIIASRLKQFKRGEAYRHFKGRFTGKTERLDKALRELETRAVVTPTAEPTKGRAAVVYLVNEALWEAV